MRENDTRVSLVDGSREEVEFSKITDQVTRYEPVFESMTETRVTLEGPEEVIVKRLVGFTKVESGKVKDL